MADTKRRGGRPLKEIKKEEFEKLCAMQCTVNEIAGFFGCSHDTIERFCKRTYRMTFSEVFAEKRSAGLISLRRSQFRMADLNPAMAIWLGKQYLGQKDLLMIDNYIESEDDPLTQSIKESMGQGKPKEESDDGI